MQVAGASGRRGATPLAATDGRPRYAANHEIQLVQHQLLKMKPTAPAGATPALEDCWRRAHMAVDLLSESSGPLCVTVKTDATEPSVTASESAGAG